MHGVFSYLTAGRAELYRQLGAELQKDPAAIYLNSLVSLTGLSQQVPAWTPRLTPWNPAPQKGGGS